MALRLRNGLFLAKPHLEFSLARNTAAYEPTLFSTGESYLSAGKIRGTVLCCTRLCSWKDDSIDVQEIAIVSIRIIAHGNGLRSINFSVVTVSRIF